MSEKQNQAGSEKSPERSTIDTKKPLENLTPKAGGKKEPIYKKKWFLPSVGVAVALIVLAVVISIATAPSYEEVDLSEMTVAEACTKARAQGWKVGEITREANAGKKTDCYDTKVVVSRYDYDSGRKEVTLQYVRQEIEEIDLKGKTVKEVCTKLRDLGWTIDDIRRQKDYSEVTAGCDSNEIVARVYYTQLEKYSYLEQDTATIYTNGEEKKEEEKDTSSNSAPAQSSSSSSSSTSSQNSTSSSSSSSSSLCTEDYQKSLDAAKAAYDLAQKNYDTYKSLGMDTSQYQTALDTAKSSLDTAQKIYDTYCK